MENLNLIGKKVVKKSGEVFNVVSTRFDEKSLIIVLDDGKLGYDLRRAIPSGLIRFEDDVVQKIVEQKVKEINENIAAKPSVPPENPIDSLLKKAVQLFKCEGAKSSPYLDHSYNFSCLQAGNIYGTKAYDIYVQCCRNLGFFTDKKNNFLPRRILYASKATPEGYAVWMLPHNNLTGTATSWANIINDDKIYEVWRMNDDGESSNRLAFIKQANGEYVFMGIYTLEKKDVINRTIDGIPIKVVKTYKRFSDKYPRD